MRWTAGHLVALVELACGVGVAAWLVGQGIAAEAAGTAGRSVLDRSFLFVLAALVGTVLCVMAARSWRAAARTTAPPTPAPPGRPAPAPAPLSPAGRREVARIVDVLAAEGVFVPRAPDPEDLAEAVADHGAPVTADVVLAALDEAGFHHPRFRLHDHSTNLAFHHSHTEQSAEVVQGQAADVRRLAGGGLDDVTVAVTIREPVGPAYPTLLRVTVDGTERELLDYPGAAKHLSTVLHVVLARILRGRATGRRLAWLWSDQGVWLTGLADGGVDRLNAALGPAAGEGWEWVDELPSTAAGDPLP